MDGAKYRIQVWSNNYSIIGKSVLKYIDNYREVLERMRDQYVFLQRDVETKLELIHTNVENKESIKVYAIFLAELDWGKGIINDKGGEGECFSVEKINWIC